MLKRAFDRNLLIEQVRRGVYRLYGDLVVMEVFRGKFCILVPALKEKTGSSVLLDLIRFYHTPTGERGIHLPVSGTEAAIVEAGFFS